ncbi:F-box protein-like protein [Tanacetum coccineum]
MAIADIHQDIIQTHILTRLDGPTLAAARCTSSQLRSLCSDHKLWFNICSSYWPSTNDPLVTKIISSFTSGHRSFFSDSFSCPLHRVNTTYSLTPTSQIISAVDLRYHNELVFSKVELTDTTASDWFQSSPFRIDLLEPKEVVPSGIEFSGDDQITCGIKGVSGELYVSGVSLTVQDMDGKCLSGKDSMLILQGLTMAERQPSDGGEGLRARYDEYIERRRERKEKNERRERRLDMVCVASGVAFLMAFWSLALY